MEKSRDFVNQYATIFPVLMLGIVILFSFGCDTVDDENLNKLLHPEETTDAAHLWPLRPSPKSPLVNRSD